MCFGTKLQSLCGTVSMASLLHIYGISVVVEKRPRSYLVCLNGMCTLSELCSKGRTARPVIVGWQRQCWLLILMADIVTRQRWAMWRQCWHATDIVGQHLGSLFWCYFLLADMSACVSGADRQVALSFGWCGFWFFLSAAPNIVSR